MSADLTHTAPAGTLAPANRARLAERLRRDRVAPPAPAGREVLVDLSAAGSGDPLFLVHGVAGTVHGFLPLANELAGNTRVLGIAATAAGEDATLGAMASRYLEAVRAAQPRGPYRIGGWSTGGLVAFEMAQQLEDDGDEVALLALLDAPYLCPREPAGSVSQLAAEFVGDAARTSGLSLHDMPDGAGVSLDDQLDWLASGLSRRGGVGEGVREELRHRFEIFRSQREMLVGHRVRGGVRADTLLVWAQRSPNIRHLPGWPTALDGRVRTLAIDTDHYGLLRPPHVRSVASFVESGFAPALPATAVTAMTLLSFS